MNWNGKVLLEQFLPTVINYSKGHNIYVVDNASEDDSVDFISSNYPNVKCITHDQNYGYAEGYNKALEEIEADIYCLLNSDVKVTKNWIDPVLEKFYSQEKISIIQPKILDINRPHKFEYAGAAGGFMDQLGYPYCRGRLFESVENDMGQYNDSRKIFWASGACFFIRSKLFKSLNGFDESFFAHMEEIDLCWRANNAEQLVWYLAKSEVFHLGGGSLSYSNPKKTFYNFRNSLYTLTKNTPGPLLLFVFCRLILDGMAGLNFLVSGKPKHTLAIIKAHLCYYKKLPNLLKFRSQNPKRIPYKGVFSIVWEYYIKCSKTFSKLNQY